MSAGSFTLCPVKHDGVRYFMYQYHTRFGGRVLVTRNPVTQTWHAAQVDASGRVLYRVVLSDAEATEAAWFDNGDTHRAVARYVCVTL